MESTLVTYVYESNEASVYEAQTLPDPMTPQLVGAAQDVYFAYYRAHGEKAMPPLGVVVDRKSLRGHLIFTGHPILLPQESFITTEQIGYGVASDDDYWE